MQDLAVFVLAHVLLSLGQVREIVDGKTNAEPKINRAEKSSEFVSVFP
jgi:hypothetical protein